MKTIKNLERLQRIHALINSETTGTAVELAELLNISRRTVYILLGQLRDLRAPLGYDGERKTYYYSDEFQLQINISISVMTGNELIKIYGGAFLTKIDSQKGCDGLRCFE